MSSEVSGSEDVGGSIVQETNTNSKVSLANISQSRQTGKLDSEAIRVSSIMLKNVCDEHEATNHHVDDNIKMKDYRSGSVQDSLHFSDTYNQKQKIAHQNTSLSPDTSKYAKQFFVMNRNISNSPTIENNANRSYINTTKSPNENSVSNSIYRDNISKAASVLKKSENNTDLDNELKTLEKRHEKKMEIINQTYDYRTEKKLDLSNKDVNVNRPSVLGPSRFESGRPSYSSATVTKSETIVPRRNEVTSTARDSIKSETPTSASSSVSQYQSPVKSKTSVDLDMFSPELRRKRFDSNFNAVPEPFKIQPSPSTSQIENHPSTQIKSAYNLGLPKSSISLTSLSFTTSYPSTTLASSYSSSITPSLTSVQFPRPTPTVSASISKPEVTTKAAPPQYGLAQAQATSTRAKSEGNGLLMPSKSQYKDFYHQIQATKDKYKSDVEKAMNFDRTTIKPPLIKDKLPRPDMTPSTLSRDFSYRRQDRESAGKERFSRGKSDDILRSSSFRY